MKENKSVEETRIMDNGQIKRGVYFLANDRIYDLVVAFLNSLRRFNPTIPLCMIPFRNDIDRLLKLKQTFNFDVYSDNEYLSCCDDISLNFHPKITGHYRKLACWHGPFDEFVYIDVDMVVLKNIDFSFRLLSHYDFITSCSNIPETERWVWKPSINNTQHLTNEQIRYAANTGFVISSKRVFSQEMIKSALADAEPLIPHMELLCKEQPLLNFLAVSSGIRFTSLFNLTDTNLFLENYIEFWAGNPRKSLMSGNVTLVSGKLRHVFLIHWAGCWQPEKNDVRLFKILKLLQLRKNMWSISKWMPLKKIWLQYRNMKQLPNH